MKLNVGSGKKRHEGFTNVDAVARPGVDIVAEAWAIPLPDGCADEIMAIHLIEHMLPWDADLALAEWFRLLQPGGKLVMEQPDLIKCCENLIAGLKGKHPDQLGLWGVFGDDRTKDPFMLHRYGYSFESLKVKVEAAGFVKVKEYQTQFHGAGRLTRDFRLEAGKP